jgi:hypothetical protein
MNAAVVEAVRESLDTTLRAYLMAFVATATPVAFVILCVARDRAVSVNDQRTKTRHTVTLRRP